MAQGERVLLADLLRGIAILLVIISHVAISLGPRSAETVQPHFGAFPFSWNTWGEVGITLFLILSGFGLGYRYRDVPFNFGQFYIKRIIRIYPIYYFSLLFGLTIQSMFALWGTLAHGQTFSLLPDFGFGDFILAITGLNPYFGKWGGPLVGASWFIGLIMSMYLLFPLIVNGLKRSPWLCVMALFSVSIAFRVMIAGSNVLSGNPMLWFPLNRVFEFGIGVVLGCLIRRDLLKQLNTYLQRVPGLSFFSELSFPLFLIHDPLRRLIGEESQPTLRIVVGLLAFGVLSALVSVVALKADKYLGQSIYRKYRFSA